MELHILRHTRPEFPANTCYGQTDYPVAESFADELAALKANVAEDYDHIIASPLQRCQVLAEALFPGQVETRPVFKEYHFGDWEGQSWEAIPRADFDVWAKDPITQPSPGGESVEGFYQRVDGGIEQLLQDFPQQKILLVAHAGVIRCVWCRVLGMPLWAFQNVELTYGELCGFRFGDDALSHRALFKIPSALSVALATMADPPTS